MPLLNVLPRVFLAVRAAGHKTGLAPAGSAAASRGSRLLPDRKAVRLSPRQLSLDAGHLTLCQVRYALACRFVTE